MLSIDKSVIVIFLIVWIMLVILNRLFFKPLVKTMAQREANIQKNKKARQEAFESYEQNMHKIEEKIEETKKKAQAMRGKFLMEALEEKESILAEISQACRSDVEKAKKELSKRLESLKKNLESESDFLAEKIEKRLLH